MLSIFSVLSKRLSSSWYPPETGAGDKQKHRDFGGRALVDFKKRLARNNSEKVTDPIRLYDTLDRAHDKGPLRPAQRLVLSDWFANHQATRDIIVKLHTGQGKTLIGLLMLQSRLNAGRAAVYLCPDHFLIDQTCEQAKQFGIKTCVSDDGLPEEFSSNSSIGRHLRAEALQWAYQIRTLISSRLRLTPFSWTTLTHVLDNSRSLPYPHPKRRACLQRTQVTFRRLIGATGRRYLCRHVEWEKRDALLPVPYWAWMPRESEVAKILSANASRKSIKFAWPLLKNLLHHCQCVLSGAAIEIEPIVVRRRVRLIC